MDVTPLVPQNQKVVQSYANARFRISGEEYAHPVIVTATAVTGWGPPEDKATFTVEMFEFLVGHIDVLLIGSGTAPMVMTPILRQTFRARGLSVDIMDTGAACRTFNVLSAEGRRVAAALIPV